MWGQSPSSQKVGYSACAGFGSKVECQCKRIYVHGRMPSAFAINVQACDLVEEHLVVPTTDMLSLAGERFGVRILSEHSGYVGHHRKRPCVIGVDGRIHGTEDESVPLAWRPVRQVRPVIRDQQPVRTGANAAQLFCDKPIVPLRDKFRAPHPLPVVPRDHDH